jgi:hypothetical protein
METKQVALCILAVIAIVAVVGLLLTMQAKKEGEVVHAYSNAVIIPDKPVRESPSYARSEDVIEAEPFKYPGYTYPSVKIPTR